jgi:hypothetical protein
MKTTKNEPEPPEWARILRKKLEEELEKARVWGLVGALPFCAPPKHFVN